MDTSPLTLGAAIIAAFVISAAWYAAWGGALARLHPSYRPESTRPAAATVAAELVRNTVLVLAMAWLVSAAEVVGVVGGLGLGLLLWAGFPLVLLAGSVFHERVPVLLAAVHAGDWLLKLLAVAAVLAAAS